MELTSRWKYFCPLFLFLVVPGDQAARSRAQSACGVHTLLVVMGPVGPGEAEVDRCSGQGDTGLN